jgi:hypothetical protein
MTAFRSLISCVLHCGRMLTQLVHACADIAMEQWIAQLSMIVCFVLALLPASAQAFDGGDAAALVFGLIFGILGVFACLGWYARKQGFASKA